MLTFLSCHLERQDIPMSPGEILIGVAGCSGLGVDFCNLMKAYGFALDQLGNLEPKQV